MRQTVGNLNLNNAVEAASDILFNEVSTKLYEGVHWALVPEWSEFRDKYKEDYKNMLNAGYSAGALVTKYDKLAANGDIYVFTDELITESLKQIFEGEDEATINENINTVLEEIKNVRNKELIELSRYLNHIYREKKQKVVPLAILSTISDRKVQYSMIVDPNIVTLHNAKVDDKKGKQAKQPPKQQTKPVKKAYTPAKISKNAERYTVELYNYRIAPQDLVALNTNYLNVMGFKISNVQFIDMHPSGNFCTVSVELDNIKGEEDVYGFSNIERDVYSAFSEGDK